MTNLRFRDYFSGFKLTSPPYLHHPESFSNDAAALKGLKLMRPFGARVELSNSGERGCAISRNFVLGRFLLGNIDKCCRANDQLLQSELLRPDAAQLLLQSEPLRPDAAQLLLRSEPLRPDAAQLMLQSEPLRPDAAQLMFQSELLRPDGAQPMFQNEPFRLKTEQPMLRGER